MAGGRGGRGGGRTGGHSSTPPAAGRGSFGADSPGGGRSSRGRGGNDRGRGRGAGRDSSSTPGGRGQRPYSAGPTFGGNTSSSYRQQSPSSSGFSRGGGRSGGGRGHYGAAREESGASIGTGVAAVAAEDRDLLLIGKDAKSPNVWELRVHPSQHFSSAWLEAVSRWAHNMAAAQQQWQQQRWQQQPPPPPVPPQPAIDMPDDDYDFSPSSSGSSSGEDEESDHSAAAAAAGDSNGGSSSGDEGEDEDGAHDMVSYLQRLSLQNRTAAEDNFSTATTAGSTCSGAKSVGAKSVGTGSAAGGSSKQQAGDGKRRQAAAVAARAAAAAAAVGVGGVDTESESSSGEWETDSEGLLEEEEGAGGDDITSPQHQQQQGGDGSSDASDASDASVEAWSDADADAALMAAEEQDLLGEPSPLSPPQGTPPPPPPPMQSQAQLQPPPPPPARPAAAAGAGVGTPGGSGGGGRGRRGEQQQQQPSVLVSLRLERQGLTDKQAQLLSSWYCSSGVSSLMSLSKLWLFNNSLGDEAAAALATMLAASPWLSELHLSHNQLSAVGVKALLGCMPPQRPRGMRPLWFRVEYNQIHAQDLEDFIQQDCASRGLVVDVARHVPAGERSVDNQTGRELNLAWNKPWRDVHVQMPWLSIQRSAPAEAAVLQTAKAVWGARPAAPQQQRQQQPAAAAAGSSSGRGVSGSSRGGGVVAAMAAAGGSSGRVDVPLPLQYGTPPPPSRPSAARPYSSIGGSSSSAVAPPPPPNFGAGVGGAAPFTTPPPPPSRNFGSSSNTPAAAAAAAAAGGGGAAGDASPAGDDAAAAAAAGGEGVGSSVVYQDGPLMLFLDTSALLAMLGGNSATPTAFKLSLLQTLAVNGRFGRGLPLEQQTFLVLADTVLKQIDSLKSGDAGVGGPVRKFLDRGLDEVGPKGLDFLTVLAAHEGEGLVADRQAAVAGSLSPSYSGPTGQKNDLAIIEVALFFRKELLEAAAAATAEAAAAQQEGAAAVAAAEAQPVILVTNDNAQLQLAKSHGLPAFKLAGASSFETGLSSLIKGGSDLSSSSLRSLMAPSATAGMGVVAQRSLQDDFDGAVACLKGLVEAYEDLSGVLGRISLLVNAVPPGGEPSALREVQELLQQHQHTTPFDTTPIPNFSTPGTTALSPVQEQQQQQGEVPQQQQLSVLEATMGNLGALERSLAGWEKRLRSHHTPSRVLKWTSSGAG